MQKRFFLSDSRTSLVAAMLAIGLTAACCSGGEDNGCGGPDYCSIEVFDPGTNSWTALNGKMDKGRSVAAAGVVGGLFYVTGGSSLKPLMVYPQLEIYNPASDRWITGASMPTGREGPVAGVIDGILYVAGGYRGTSFRSDLYYYNPASDTWASGTSMSTPRYGAMAGVIGGELFVVGGNNTSTLDVLQIYDPGTDSWRTGTAMPTARSQGSAVVVNGLLYVIGGYLSNDAVTGIVEAYDPVLDSWSTVTAMPTARGETVAGVIGGLVYVAGGNLSSNPTVDDIVALMEIYDPVGDSWSTGPSMLLPRGEAMEGVIAGKLYVVGGYFR